MRKTWKRALSFVLSAALVLTAGAFGSVKKDAKAAGLSKSFKISITNNGGIWGWGGEASGSATSLEINDFGSYTLSGKVTADAVVGTGALWLETDLEALPTDYQLVPKAMRINGKEVEEWGNNAATTMNDNSGKKYYIIGVWNQWAADNQARNPLKEAVEFKVDDVVEFDIAVVPGAAQDSDKTEPGKDVAKFKMEIADNNSIWQWDEAGKKSIIPATPDAWSVDVTTSGVVNLRTQAGQDGEIGKMAAWVSTDLKAIPTDFEVVGKTVTIGDQGFDYSAAKLYDDQGNIRLGLWNEWGDEKANPLGAGAKGKKFAKGDLITISISVAKKSGGDNVKPTVTPPKKDDPAVKDTVKTLGTAKGKKFTAGSFTYKVTKAATITTVSKKKTTGSVAVVGLSKAGKKAKSINVKNTVSVKSTGAKYNVTSVGSKAFQKAKKLTKATLGSKIKSIPTSAFNADKKLTTVKATGVTKIGASAFKGCVKLNKLTLGKKKLSSVKKGAFKGCKKTIKVSGGSKKVKKANVKKLKKSGYKKFK